MRNAATAHPDHPWSLIFLQAIEHPSQWLLRQDRGRRACKARIVERTARLPLTLCIAYFLALVLDVAPEAQRARRTLEIPCRRPRRGICRTFSALSPAMQMLAHPRWGRPAYQ